jgi:preprotein translocase subunit SecA
MIVREWLKKLMDTSERDVKRLMPIVQKINALEPDFQSYRTSNYARKQTNLGSDCKTAQRWTTSCPKRSQRVVKPRDAR